MSPSSPLEGARGRLLPFALPRMSFATARAAARADRAGDPGRRHQRCLRESGQHLEPADPQRFIGIIAIGATLVISSGGLDLSVGAMSALLAGVMIIAMNAMVPALGTGWLTIACGIVVALVLGLCAGAFNGLVITRVGIEPFIVTLGTMGIFRSLVTWLADGGTLSLDFEIRGVYRPAYYGTLLGIPFPIWVFAGMAVVGAVLLNLTAFGRRAVAIGSNELVARYSTIDVERTKLPGVRLSGAVRRHRDHHLRPKTRFRIGRHRAALGARSDRRRDHRRHAPQGRLRQGLVIAATAVLALGTAGASAQEEETTIGVSIPAATHG